MATIFNRLNKNGTITTRVMIRRKGLPIFCLAFDDENEAKDWIEENEQKYIKDHEPYIKWIEENRLELQREREFRKK